MKQSKWVVKFKHNPNCNLKIFCLPFAGGGATMYRTWAQYLPESVEVCAIQPPGRESRLRDPLITKMSELVKAIAEAIEGELDKPFIIFGHSLGALVGFELTKLLRRKGLPLPLLLAVSGHAAPHTSSQNPILHEMSDTELVQTLRKYNGTPEEVLSNSELLGLFLPTIRADFKVLETHLYKPEPPLDLPISAFAGHQDPRVALEELKAWRFQTSSKFTSRVFSGGHFFIHSEHLAIIESLKEDLAPYMELKDTSNRMGLGRYIK